MLFVHHYKTTYDIAHYIPTSLRKSKGSKLSPFSPSTEINDIMQKI